MRETTIMVAALVALAGCNKSKSNSTETTSAEAPAITVSASQLVDDYKANEVRADGQYKGKRLAVSGVVGDIKKDFADSIYVTIGKGGQFDIETAMAYFPAELTEKASALNKGTTISVECTGHGKVLMSPVLKECKFLAAPSGAVAAKAAPAAITAESVCAKLEAAGVAKSCEKTEQGAKFSVPGTKDGGAIVVNSSDEKFTKYVTLVEGQPDTSPLKPYLMSPKARVVVHLPKGMPLAEQAKFKPIVDSL